MTLTFEQKQELGLKFLTDLLTPATPFGAERLRQQRFYRPEEREELEAELDNTQIMYRALEEAPDAVAALEHAMSRIRDVRGSLRTCREGGRLGEVELFQLNAFLLELGRTVPLARALPGYGQMHGAALDGCAGALEILDPAGSGRLTFYIEDARTGALLELRRAKRALEGELAACAPDRRAELIARRLELVKGEEQELARIYARMSEALAPWADRLLADAAALAVLDAALQRARLARRFPSVRPVLGGEALELTDGVNPMVAEALAESGRRFTPITLRMPRGVTVLTGANMGGKSVAMQTVALNVCLAHMGYFVFCSRAEMPLFRHVELINRDFSSARDGLSGFGGEIVRFNEAAARLGADAPSLIILDEFARGTNCDEGAAILRAVADWLGGQNACTLLSTHYDGAAEHAAARYQVRGLSRMPEQLPGPGADRLRLIGESMDYGLIPVDRDRPCPRDAVKVCRLLGMEGEILKKITNSP